MQLVREEIEARVVAAAEEVARSLPTGESHTVGAAVMDVHGDVYTGANVFHFTGGPCAELVAVGAAAAAGAGALRTIVAVGDGGRGVLAPCGRCRQVLLDLHPDIVVIVRTEGTELVGVPVRDLLPFSYRPSGTATTSG